MSKYYESESEVEAFEIRHDFKFLGVDFKFGDYIVIKNGEAKLISGKEFKEKFKKVETYTGIKSPLIPQYIPVPEAPRYEPLVPKQGEPSRPWWDQVYCNAEAQLNANNII